MDISNREQYVIARLDEAEAEIARLDAEKAEAEERIAELKREAGKAAERRRPLSSRGCGAWLRR